MNKMGAGAKMCKKIMESLLLYIKNAVKIFGKISLGIGLFYPIIIKNNNLEIC